MKKISLLCAAGIALSLTAGMSSAATIASNVDILPAAVCDLMTESVRVNLSSGTTAVYGCNAANNGVGFAACNSQGRKSTYSVQIEDPDSTDPENPEMITEERVGGTYYFTSTHGGNVGSDGGECSAATLQPVANNQALLPENRQ